MPNKKGFTLVEVLLITFLIGLLGVAAISAYIGSTKTFSFLSNYKNVMSSIRTARSYAITSKDGDTVDRYGVKIGEQTVTLFADVGMTFFQFDRGDREIKNYNFGDTYVIESQDVVLPLYLFYETGNGELYSYHDNGEFLSKTNTKHIGLRFSATDEDLERFIVIFQVSGLAEEFVNPPQP